ncbi:MAG: hypothetical protein QOD99_1682 [Chthoniobacter sp.]|jgi:hypothetical protein|nr:hypothetical protein [Chthoniobacter sp.]
MKMNQMLIIVAIALADAALTLHAQPPEAPQPGGPQGGPGAGGPPGGPQRPPPPIVAALDANHDGVVDATEIANASAALKTLDKNGDGQLTREEMMPPRGPRGGGQGGAPGDQGNGGNRPKRGGKGGPGGGAGADQAPAL